MNLRYRTILSALKKNLLLDLITGGLQAFSLRRLNSKYTGACMRVRRGWDNEEADIGFANGIIDVDALYEFLQVNGFEHSENFANAYWSKNNTTITSNATLAPNGSMTADRLNETTGSNNIIALFGNGTPMHFNSRQVLSFYLKKGNVDWIQVFSTTAISANLWANFNLDTGTIGNVGSDTDAYMEDVGNGWYRCEIVHKTDSPANNSGGGVGFINNTDYDGRYSTLTYSGDDNTHVFVWGASQQSNFFYKYFQTTTEAKDDLMVVNWYDQTGNDNHAEQTSASLQPPMIRRMNIYFENEIPMITFNSNTVLNKPNLYGGRSNATSSIVFNKRNVSGNQDIESASVSGTSGTVANLYRISGSGVSFIVRRQSGDGSTSLNLGNNVPETTQLAIGGARYVAGNLRGSLDGVEAGNSNLPTSGVSTSTGTASTIGRALGGTNQFLGYIGEFTLFERDFEDIKTVLTDNIDDAYEIL